VGSVASLAVAPSCCARSSQGRRPPAVRDGAGARGRPHRRASHAHERDPSARVLPRTRTSTRGQRARVEDLPARPARAALQPAASRLAAAPRCRRPAPAAGLAARIQVRAWLRDFASFAHRDEMRETMGKRRPGACRRIIELVRPPSAKALAGEGCFTRGRAARELMTAFQSEDSRPVTAILRRPLVLLLDELDGPPA